MVERVGPLPQNRLLSREIVPIKLAPEKQQLLIVRATEQVQQIRNLHPEALLEREQMEADKPFLLRDGVFRNPFQAINSRHDIRHAAEFRLLAPFIGRVVEAETGEQVNENVLRLGMFHDTKRGGDLANSAPFFIQLHGRAAAKDLPNLSDGMVGINDEDRQLAAGIMRIHDIHKTPKAYAQNPTAKVFIGTDRLLLGRILYAKEVAAVKVVSPYLVHRRHKYPAKYFEMDTFKDIADAIFLLSITDINNQVAQGVKNPDQFDAVIRAGEKLGMFVSPKTIVAGEVSGKVAA